MPSNFAFLLSMYLTLILGSVTLGYSEFDYLPEVTAFTGVVAVLMIVAFVMDLRGRHLPLDRANQMGLVIFAVTAVWIYIHYRQPDSLLHTLPWPAGSLPYVAPLLMVLVPAKLFRPKHVGDWWALQAMSLCGVGLAVSLAEDLVCVVLVLIYSISAVWSLTLFYLYRVAGKISPYPGKKFAAHPKTGGSLFLPEYWFSKLSPRKNEIILAEAFEGLAPPSPAERLGRSHFMRSLRWIAVAGLLSTPLFFLTPRIAGMHWELFQSRMETGFSADNAPDLSRTGQLKPSKEVAFEVIVQTRDGKPVETLPADMRWRGAGFADYQTPRGRWQKSNAGIIFRITEEQLVFRPTERLEFPSFGPDSWYYDYRIVGKSGGPCFADPVAFHIGQRAPAAIPFRAGYNYAVQAWDASFVLLPGRDSRIINRYLQVNRSMNREDTTPAGTFALADDTDPNVLAPFLQTPPTEVIRYANQMVEKMFQDGILGPNIRQRWLRSGQRFHTDDHAAVAAAFNDHFSNGTFGYSLDLRRDDRNLDPIEDFLLNTRNGHCERFASSLVLMLRAVGIPSQLATGFRGAEANGVGRYVVRQDHAHAWAEVLLGKPSRNGGIWHWQAFDPTPAFSGPLENENAGLIDSSTKQGKRLLTEFIVGLNSDNQKRLHEGLTSFVETYWPWLACGVGSCILIALLIRFRRNKSKRIGAVTHIDAVPWYSIWLKTLANAGLAKHAAETPFEHATRIRKLIQDDPQCVAHADLPMRVARLLDRVRYAGETVPPEQITEIETAMRKFATA